MQGDRPSRGLNRRDFMKFTGGSLAAGVVSSGALLEFLAACQQQVPAAQTGPSLTIGIANEPGTVGFFVSQEQENPSVFTTYERFLDQAAMDAHNDSQVVARFFGIAKPILDGDVILVTSTEISAKA